MHVTELVMRPLADAFMSVGVPVAVLVGLAGVLQVRSGDRVRRWLLAHSCLGPLVGALLAVTPGCGVEIALMPLYIGGGITFGTVVAALTATMGDSAFVLIAADPQAALAVHALLLGVEHPRRLHGERGSRRGHAVPAHPEGPGH